MSRVQWFAVSTVMLIGSAKLNGTETLAGSIIGAILGFASGYILSLKVIR